MPLLSNKLYILNKIRKEKKDDELVFCHSLTNEICENEDELNRKTFLYNQKIWTCRITGQVNLTFKEALKSEQGCAKMLKNSFKKCFEAAVLQFVHHSKESLDTLIHKAWTQIHQEFCVNEPVTIKLTAPKELILKGIVVKVDRSKANEDKDQENSPIKLNSDASSSDKENIKKKIIPIKKNYFYSVKIFEMDKLVKDIPAETIDRTLRPPSKDQIRMFIRAHAIRHSGKQNYPWVVDDELVKKYRLPVLEPEFVADKQKMRELSLFTEVQVYNKMREETPQREDEMMVDLTRSDDDDDAKAAGVARRKTADTSIRDSRTSGASGKQKKKLKQATLFDVQTPTNLANQNSSSSTLQRSSSIRSPLTSPTRSLPPLAQRLLKLVKETPSDPNVKQLVFKCCQLFSNQQISKFPDIIRSPIKARKEKLDEKKRIDAMSPEEREAYLTQKRNQVRQQLRERKREENAKLEDNEIKYTKKIPEGSPVPMEAGLSQDQWARIVSVSEFVRCYKRLLVPSGEFTSDDSGVIHVHELCRSVVGNSDEEHAVLSKLVCVLLKTLLQDNRVRNRREMGLCMTELPVTACTAGELLRLVLPLDNEKRDSRNADETVVDNNNDDNNNDDAREAVDDVDEGHNNEVLTHNNNNKIAGPICEKLESHELHELSIEDKIAILELLQSRILELDVVSSFIDEYQREVCEAYKKKVVDTKELNDKLKVVRQSKQSMCRLAPTMLANGNSGVTDSAADMSALSNEESSQVVRRRQSIEQKLKESEEKERRLEKERQYQKLEKEELLYKKSIEQCQKSYVTAISDAKQLMRVQPLGSDRHYRRYWHFSTAPGSLYVETELLNGGDCGATSTAWTRFISPDELNELLDSLCEKGIRESSLRVELEAILPKLREEMEEQAQNTNVPVQVIPLAKGDSFLVDGFKQELKETELSIRQGSLGGVDDYNEWQKCLDKATSMGDMKQALVAVFLGVHERFWNVPMKSANGRSEFLNAVEHARTQGRLNVLQSFLDACVCWSKSAKDDKCRVCRKNSDENAMLLCDSCNHAFHTFCLRPPLHEVPEGEWFCPHCKPVSRAKDTEGAHNEAAASVAASSARDQNKQKSKTRQGTAANSEQCCVCQAPNADQLAKCTSCKKCFHAQCHEPPLRQIRRTNWHCCECRLDEAAVHKNRHSNNRVKHNGTVEDVDADEEKERDDDSDKETPPKATKVTATKKAAKKAAGNNSSGKVNGVVKRKKPLHEDELDEDEDEETVPQKRPRYAANNVTKTEDTVDGKKSEQDESDVDMDNLSSLFARRSSRRKRTSTEDNVNNGVTSSPSGTNKRARNSHSAPEKIEKACQSMLKHLLNHKASWPFRDAVDPTEVPDYYQIITNPMDLVRMMDKLKQGAYRNGVDALKQFIADIGQIFYNAELYNLPDSNIMGLACSLEEFFKGIYSKYDFGVEYSRMTDE